MASRLNVDPAEIAKFEELASRWWDKNSEFKPLHDINPLRVDYIDTHAGLAGKRVIDVGCGGGLLSRQFAPIAETVIGVDPDEASICTARSVSAPW